MSEKRMIKSPQPPYPVRWGINRSIMMVKILYIVKLFLSCSLIQVISANNMQECKCNGKQSTNYVE